MNAPEEYERVELARIQEPADPLRDAIDPEKLGELMDSMAAEGLHQPVGVAGPAPDGSYVLAWGHRRLLAARLLNWTTLPCRVHPHGTDLDLAAVSENLQRTDLNPVEEARACARFVERGMPLAHIARLFRRSQAWVNERRRLLELPADLQAAVAEKRLSLAVVSVLADVDHEPYRLDLVREAERTGATAATAEVWRAHFLSDRERIIRNDRTIEQIRTDRAAFVVTYPCDWCGELAVYEQTRGWRFCDGCGSQFLEAKRRSAAPAAG